MKKLMGVMALVCLGVGAFGYEVVWPMAAQPWERTAVDELTNWLGPVSGGCVTVGGRADVVFHVGDTEFAAEKGLAASAFQDEEWCVKSFGNHVVLNGGGTRGCLYAVYHFLEDDCGIRWWNDDDFDVPEAKPLAFSELNRRGRPYFRYRDIYRDYGRIPEPLTPVRMRLNGNGPGHIPLALGGGIEYGGVYLTHTFGRYLPFEKYGKEHPEWYAWHKKDGKRDGGMFTGQFCLSNKEMLKVLAEKVRTAIEEDKVKFAKQGLAQPKIYSLVMNDSKYPCECDACLAEVAVRGYSGQMVRFVNAIIAEVAKDRPELLFKTSAYLYTETPPKDDTRASDQIVLDIATTTDNLAGPIDDPGCAFVRKTIEGWQSHAKNLFVWTYSVTFEKSTLGWPFPSEYHLPGKMRFYAENNAKVYFAEQEHSKTADMYELKLYIQRKMAEDPFADGAALRADFMRRYYGAAGDAVAAARALLEANRQATKATVSWFPRRDEFAWITDETVAGMRAQFDAAERAVAGDPKRLKRVKVARKSVDRVYDSRVYFRGLKGNYALREFYLHDGRRMKLTNGVLRITANTDAFSKANVLRGGLSGMAHGVDFKPMGPEREGEWTTYEARVEKASSGYFYFCNWQVQLATGLPEQKGRDLVMRLRARFTGPRFYPGSTQPDIVEVNAFGVR